MNSKECLERLLKIAYVEPGPTKEKFITYARETEHNKICLDLYNIISQDLDRLEKLEKENQKLKEKYKHRAETSNDLCKAVNQYEKVIEILVNKTIHFMFLKTTPNVETYNKHSDTYNYDKLTKKEYELLKEVL